MYKSSCGTAATKKYLYKQFDTILRLFGICNNKSERYIWLRNTYHFHNLNLSILITAITDIFSTRGRSILHPLSQICVYLFPIIAFQSSIPVFSIIIKYNLTQNGICSKRKYHHSTTLNQIIFEFIFLKKEKSIAFDEPIVIIFLK